MVERLLIGTGEAAEEIIDAIYESPDPEDEPSWYEFRPSDFALRWTLDEVVSQPLRANEIPRDEIPTLLLESSKRLMELAAVHSVLAAMMISSPAENLKPAEKDDDLIGKTEAAQLLGVLPNWFRGRKLPFKRRLSHRTVKYSRKGLLKWREAQAIRR
jgi:hypothetical protein